jgi:transcriptional regulator with XRE-family HTH domain
MSTSTRALRQLPPATLGALQKLGADLAVARLRRKESLRTWAKRLGVSVSTLQRLEAGDPAVSIGVIASALWLINRDGALGDLATPENRLRAHLSSTFDKPWNWAVPVHKRQQIPVCGQQAPCNRQE